jgi:Arc/MetJ family transcription regulator
MKTTIDIPDQELEDAMKFTGAKTKREAIVTAISEFNRRRRMAQLLKYSASSKSLITADELQKRRRKE